jgi:CBS domain-containing protein
MKVAEVMTVGVRTCELDDSASYAARIMWESDCGSVVVVNSEGIAVGMITDRDICMAAYTQGVPLSQIRVSTAASHQLYAVHEQDSLEHAERMMQDRKVRRLPVVDRQGIPLGMLSMNDLAREVYRAPQKNAELSPDALVRTLAAVCQPTMRETHYSPA